MPGENFTKEPKEVLHARSSIHSHSQLATHNTSPSSLPDSSASSFCSSVSDKCLEPEPERSSSPGSNSDVPPSQLKATSEITPGSADDMCLSSRPLERREQGLQRSTGEGRGHSLTNVCQLGFPNIGNTCFMNATLQCLLSLTCFWTPIIAQQASWMDTASSQMLRCLAELQQARLSSSKKQKKQLLRALKSCLSARCPAFDGYDQEDAHEFLMLILLQLKEEGEALRTSCVSSICPVEHFEFQLKSVRTCTSCGLQVSRVEDFNHLSINLRSTLAHSLHAYFQPTDIEISCECEQGCRASEVQEFSTLPRVLILHVMRFDMLDYGEKLKDRMDIPAQLDLSDFPGVASLGKQSSGSTSFQASPRSSLRPGSADDMCLSSRPLERPVVVQLKSVRTCTSCGLQVSRVEDFNHLSLNLRSTLAHSLHAYFQPTDIEISCECEQGCRASEVQEFSTLPRVLILHVMRFDMLDYGEKLKDRMDIPAQLDLSDFPGVASLGKQSSGSTSFQASPRSSLRPGVSTHRPLQTAWCCVSFGEQLGQRPLHQ
ncbi:hypothetical protein SRHO_G00341140 [Serrasalmus rhombeus]